MILNFVLLFVAIITKLLQWYLIKNKELQLKLN